MPKAFMHCAKSGGKVRYMKAGKNKQRKICFPKNGKSAKLGHMERRKKKK